MKSDLYTHDGHREIKSKENVPLDNPDPEKQEYVGEFTIFLRHPYSRDSINEALEIIRDKVDDINDGAFALIEDAIKGPPDSWLGVNAARLVKVKGHREKTKIEFFE